MFAKSTGKGILFFLLFAVTVSAPAFASSAAIGSVAGSTNASVGGQPLVPNALIFSGDTLNVTDGAAAIAMTNGSRLVFGKDTTASLLRDQVEVTVLLLHGSVSLYHRDSVGSIRVRAGALSVVPESGFKTLGEVAMLNGALVVTSKAGMLRVEGNGTPVEVPQGKTITIQPGTARAPQGGGPATGTKASITTIAAWGGLATGVLGTIIGFDARSRADDANSTALRASQAAASAAQAAAAAANAAAAATQAASAASTLAGTAATLAIAASNVVGCDLNKFANSQGQPSPYLPPSGYSCP